MKKTTLLILIILISTLSWCQTTTSRFETDSSFIEISADTTWQFEQTRTIIDSAKKITKVKIEKAVDIYSYTTETLKKTKKQIHKRFTNGILVHKSETDSFEYKIGLAYDYDEKTGDLTRIKNYDTRSFTIFFDYPFKLLVAKIKEKADSVLLKKYGAKCFKENIKWDFEFSNINLECIAYPFLNDSLESVKHNKSYNRKIFSHTWSDPINNYAKCEEPVSYALTYDLEVSANKTYKHSISIMLDRDGILLENRSFLPNIDKLLSE